jgi:ubiquitin-protein ligase
MTSIIKKETVHRLLHDIKQIIKSPLTENGIYYIHDDTDMLTGYAMIVGPEDTPYFGGYYFFQLAYPTDYPHSPPKVTYCTNGLNVRFNPNLYTCGKVCVSLLNTWSGDQWTSCQTISTVLLTLCSLLCEKPLLNEPGITDTHTDMRNYNEIILFANLHTAVCDIVQKKPTVFKPFFELFYSNIKETFLKNAGKLAEVAERKNEALSGKQAVLKTRIYSMVVTIDYNSVIDRLKKCREFVS